MSYRYFHASCAVLLFGLLTACNAGHGQMAIDADLRLFETGRSREKNDLRRPLSERVFSKDTLVAQAERRQAGLMAEGFTMGETGSRVVVRTFAGEIEAEHQLPSTLQALHWSSRGDLLAVGYRIQRYSFGANVTQTLYRLTTQPVEKVVLADLTVKPSTARAMAAKADLFMTHVFSPMGDELVYSRYHDPPDAMPYIMLVHRNWQSGKERTLLRLSVAPIRLAWAGSDRVVVHSGDSPPRQLELWTLPLKFVPVTIDEDPQADAYNQKDWALRRWRFEGLITPQEYQQQQEMQP